MVIEVGSRSKGVLLQSGEEQMLGKIQKQVGEEA